MDTREEITSILLKSSGSMMKFTEHKGFIDNLIIENTQLKADLLESYRAIVSKFRRVELATEKELLEGGNHEKYCIYCGTENLTFKDSNHTDACVVLKAEKYIKENNRNE